MLPRFAAQVTRIRQFIMVRLSGRFFKSMIAKGTSVTRVTSFVMNIERTNERPVRIRQMALVDLTLARSLEVSTSNVPISTRQLTTSIRQKRIDKTRVLMYETYCMSGCTKKQETKARIPDKTKTALLLQKLTILFIRRNYTTKLCN